MLLSGRGMCTVTIACLLRTKKPKAFCYHKAKKYFLPLCFHIYLPLASPGRLLLPIRMTSWVILSCYSLLNKESVQSTILLVRVVQKYAFTPVWEFVSVLSPLLSQEAVTCSMVFWWMMLCENAKWDKTFLSYEVELLCVSINSNFFLFWNV